MINDQTKFQADLLKSIKEMKTDQAAHVSTVINGESVKVAIADDVKKSADKLKKQYSKALEILKNR
jgi:hypothetical protein